MRPAREYFPREKSRAWDSMQKSRERYQIIVITITNNNFRLRYVSSKLDHVLLLLLLTNKLGTKNSPRNIKLKPAIEYTIS
jgi:hypothetical protein